MTFTRNLLLTLLFAFGWLGIIRSQGFELARTAGGPSGGEAAYDIVVDKQGNVFFIGAVRENAVFDGDTLNNNGLFDFMMASYDHQGNKRWVRQVGGSGPDKGFGLSLDPSGNVIGTGYAKLTIGPNGGAPVRHLYDGLILKYDNLSTFLWIKEFNGTILTQGKDVAVDQAGNVYAVGFHDDRTYFPNGDSILSNGGADIFVFKYAPNGNRIWEKTFGGINDELDARIHIDKNDNIYLMGTFVGTAYLGTDSVVGLSSNDIFLARLDVNGNVIWSTSFNGTGDDRAGGLSTDPNGNVYVSGYFNDSLTIGSDLLETSGSRDGYIAKFDPNGVFKWSRQIGGTDDDRIFGMDVNEKGRVFSCGYFNGTSIFGTDTINSTGLKDCFFTELDTLGNFDSTITFGSASNETLEGITVNAAGTVYGCGQFFAGFNLGGTTLQSKGSEDLYYFKHCENKAISIPSLTGFPFCRNQTISVDYEVLGCFDPGTMFYLELSDSAGSFASPTVIDSSTGYLGGNITGLIPTSIPGGSGYRIRIRAGQPAFAGSDNGFDFTILESFANQVNITGDTVLCPGDTIWLDAGTGFTVYSWSNGLTSQAIPVTAAGTYTVTVYDSLGCSNTASHNVSLCVSRIGSLTEQINIYPNPTDDILNIESKNWNNDLEIRLTDLHGRVILEKLIRPDRQGLTQIDLGDYSSGLYILQIQSGNERLTRKIQLK